MKVLLKKELKYCCVAQNDNDDYCLINTRKDIIVISIKQEQIDAT